MIKEIVQKGAAILNQTADNIDFSRDQDELTRIAADITDTIKYLLTTHEFSKGIGLAAPQIGFSKRIFGFAPPQTPITIYINPEIVEKSEDTDFQFEGCLSFFNVRGRVERALSLRLKYFDINGNAFQNSFSDGDARLIQHEMDHLNGILYAEKMAHEDDLVPYEKYLNMKERNWQY